MNELILILRHNITLETDVNLAIAEVLALLKAEDCQIEKLCSKEELENRITKYISSRETYLVSFALRALRGSGTLALSVATIEISKLEKIIMKSSFVQEVLCFSSKDFRRTAHVPQKLIRTCMCGDWYCSYGIPIATVLEYSASLITRRKKMGSIEEALDELLIFLLDRIPISKQNASHLSQAIKAKKTTLYLSHELHVYKGKFFPRLVRSLINRFAPDSDGQIADIFLGSGTTLLEAFLLGHESFGNDIDPTAVLISENKTSLWNSDPLEIRRVCSSISSAIYPQDGLFSNSFSLSNWESEIVSIPEPMRSRLIKRGNEEGYDLLGEIERDAAKARLFIKQIPVRLQPIFRVCLSHALTKKVRLRFVGIGNGRFTFDVAKAEVLDLFTQKAYHMLAISESFAWLKGLGLEIKSTSVYRKSALELNEVYLPESLDLIITSPPYIPASSGREHYARARAIPLVLTDAAKLEELEELDRAFIGEMRSGEDITAAENLMPTSVQQTLDFLKNDKQRYPKYLPTLQYYMDMYRTLCQAQRVVKRDGKILLVVSKSHTFYIHKTKEILYNVDAVTSLEEIGAQANLKVIDILDVPLQKSGGLNARPRSTDSYTESVIIFAKK